MTGSSVGRRASSAKPKKDSKRERKILDMEKISVKARSKNGDEEYEAMMENESLFQNKILETVGIRRKKSDAILDDGETIASNLNM